MKAGDLVKLVRKYVANPYEGFGIITSVRQTLPSQQPLYTVHWNNEMGNGCYWDDELEVLSANR